MDIDSSSSKSKWGIITLLITKVSSLHYIFNIKVISSLAGLSGLVGFAGSYLEHTGSLPMALVIVISTIALSLLLSVLVTIAHLRELGWCVSRENVDHGSTELPPLQDRDQTSMKSETT